MALILIYLGLCVCLIEHLKLAPSHSSSPMVYASGRAVDQPDMVSGPEQPSVALGTFNGATLEFFFLKSLMTK